MAHRQPGAHAGWVSTDAHRTAKGPVAGFLDNPVVGMAPWIIFSLLVGPGRFELAVGLALATAVALIAVGHLVNRGSSWKLLELADVVFFASMAVIGALVDDGTLRWLETYAGEVANIALAVIAFGSMAIRMPFTIQYAREQVDPSLWHTRGFLHTNYMITGAWGIAFLVAAAAGAYGDLVLHNPNNIWTGWIIQILAIVAAVKFTVWYPDVARARAVREASGLPAEPTRWAGFLVPLAGLLVPIGIAVLIFDNMWWLGVALIVVGSLLTKRLQARSQAPG